MERTQQRTIALAEEMAKCLPSAGWKRCLALARERHDPTRPVSVNIVGSYGMTHEDYIRNLFAAKIRHEFTPYDAYLRNGFPKEEARKLVAPLVAQKLREWSI